MIKLTFIIISATFTSYCQKKNELLKTPVHTDTLYFILKVDSGKEMLSTEMIFDINRAINIEPISDTSVLNRFRKNLSYSVKFTFRKGTDILSYPELLKTFNIDDSTINLPCYVDSVLFPHPETVYYERSEIKWLALSKETQTDIRYISIRTRLPINRRKDGTIYTLFQDTKKKE